MRRWLPLTVLMLLASVTTGSAHAAGERTFVLYFSSWSALIEPEAAEIVAPLRSLFIARACA